MGAGDVRVAELSREFGAVGSTLKALAAKGGLWWWNADGACAAWKVRVTGRRSRRGRCPGQPGGPLCGPTSSPRAKRLPSPPSNRPEPRRRAWCSWTASPVPARPRCTCRPSAHARRGAPRHRARAGNLAHPQTVARFRGHFGDAGNHALPQATARLRPVGLHQKRRGQSSWAPAARCSRLRPTWGSSSSTRSTGSYKQDSSPRYHARDGRMDDGPGRRCAGARLSHPFHQSLYQVNRTRAGRRRRCPETRQRATHAAIEVVDMAAEFASGSRAMFSRTPRPGAGRGARTEPQGGASAEPARLREVPSVSRLRFRAQCPHCSTSLTYHERGAKLICHHCGYTVGAPSCLRIAAAPT